MFPGGMNSKTDRTAERPVAKGCAPAGQVRQHRPSAIRNVLSNWAGFIVSTLVALFVSPFVVRHLGDSAYGIWILMGSLTGYLGLLNLGVRGAVTRYIASFHAVDDHREVNKITSTAFVIFLGAGVIAILVSVILALLAVNLFHIPHSYRLAAQAILILAGFNVAASLIGGVFDGILVALERFDLVNLVEVGSGVLRTITIVLALLSGRGLITLAVIQLFFTAVTGATYIWLSFRNCPHLQLMVAACDWQHVQMIFSFSLYLFVLTISNNLIFYTDSIVIGHFLSVGMITLFAIAANLIKCSRDLIRGISTTVTPRASALDAGGNEEGVRKILLKGAQYATVIFLPIAVTFMLRGTSFIKLWMGPEYAEPSGHVLWILAVSLVFMAGELVAGSTMVGISMHKPLAKIYFVEALCNLALSVALIRPMGIYGVAWGTTLPSLAVSLVFWPWYVRHTLGIPVSTYLISTWLRPAIAAMPFVILTYIVERLWPAPNLFAFFLQTIAILPSIGFPAWYLCLNSSDRKIYAHKFMQPVLRTIRS